nr:MAG TPA: hypothetical protein [Caudoviricetes sp.]
MIHGINTKAQCGQLPCPVLLQRPHSFSRSLQFHKGHPSTGEENQAVGHPIQSGRNEFNSQPTTLFYLRDKLLFYHTFPHENSSCSFVLFPVLKILYVRTRIYVCLFLYISLSFILKMAFLRNIGTGYRQTLNFKDFLPVPVRCSEILQGYNGTFPS